MTLSAGTGRCRCGRIDTAGNTTAGTGHSYTLETTAPTAVATVTALSADTGSSGDFITNAASQTVSGTFTGTLGAGEKIQVSAMARPGSMERRGRRGRRRRDAVRGLRHAVGSDHRRGATRRRTGHSYTLDTAAPTAIATVTAISADSGTAGDFITNVASQTVSGTFTGTLGAGEKIQVSADGTTWVEATTGGGTFTAPA